MKLRYLYLVLFLLFAFNLLAQTHTEVTIEDAQTITGAKTFSGNSLFSNLNLTIYADQQSGADACAKINAAFALLPTTGTGAGGIVDATGFTGDQSCSAGITFAPANSSVALKLGNARFIVGGSGAALTCPATIACAIFGVPTNTGTPGWGSTIIHNGAGNDGVDWFGSYGMIENLHINSSNITCASTCSSLLIKGTAGVGASHNVFTNVRLSGPGLGITNSAGVTLSADTSLALACCNNFIGLSVSTYVDGIRMVTTNNQGPTDNWWYGTYDFNNVTGVDIISGDVNGYLGGIIATTTTGINVASGATGNQFWTRLESNTTNCNSSGTGGFFLLTQDASSCNVSAGANGDNFLGTGNSGVLPSQRLQSSLVLPTGTALEWDGDTGLSRLAAGVIAAGNSSPGNTSGQFRAAQFVATGAATLTGTGACASRSTQLGGSTAGQVTCTGTTGASTLIITTGASAPNGTACWANDITHTLVASQSAVSATACTMTFSSVTTSDVLTFGALFY